ncbi:hypothetical protein KP509_20G032800 [Ceratopteris richardii]|uniref:Dirigent protein n=1 Tax=Ceratopteris richardii TaxID=49495 RepID=A0A8T2SG19_CERRI|nr:hypothetical protein KP509_20G032800 [Ceratopteris richardii]
MASLNKHLSMMEGAYDLPVTRKASIVWIALVLLPSLISKPVTSEHHNPPKFKEKKLQYYVQLETGLPGISLNFIPPIDPAFSAGFGSGTIFALNITKTVSRSSEQLGAVRGYTVQTGYLALPDSWLLETAMIVYDDGKYKGTIQVQGLVQEELTEVAIVGGSGSFRGAQGVVVVTVVVDELPFRTFHHDITFF